ncbi:hypothetical protein EG329_000900 [Mollisiaceae sp. DMI_Dod_QoI]|nr:hypothetical protein EG329_000900 [Helotiales sp. DMI_Dod_QoI]
MSAAGPAVSSHTRSKHTGILLSLPTTTTTTRRRRSASATKQSGSEVPEWFKYWKSAFKSNAFEYPVGESAEMKERRAREKKERKRRQRMGGIGSQGRRKKWRNGRAGALVTLVGRDGGRFRAG